MIICPDDHMTTRSREDMSSAFRRSFYRLKAALKKGRRLIVLSGLPGSGKSRWAKTNDSREIVIFDACSLSSKERRKLLNAGWDQGVPVDCIEFLATVERCQVRQQRRSGPEKVPAERVREMHDRRERVSRDEGFVRVGRVH